MMRLEGRRVLVTGGGRGIGAAVACRLASEGADVAFTFRQGEAGAMALARRIGRQGRRALALQADSARPAAVEGAVAAAAAALGGLDVLVNNAGVVRGGPLASMALADIEAMIDVNVRGTVAATRSALAHLPRGGRVINIGSCLAERTPTSGVAVYVMTKAALGGLTRALARELGPQGVTVNLIHPGPTDTDMNPARGPGAAEQVRATALGRYGTPDEVADVVAFLAGPDAAYVTGAAIAVDGGFSA